ncbi:MAG TPA: twin-arginine translocase TatA/TatE family subunit [Verrucomicrobiae bacterium]|jgi:sec-independent protein translocase protein TatA
MNIMFAGMPGGWEMFMIVGAVLVLFGAKRIPEFAKGLGQGIREFKKASREVTDEVNNAAESNAQPKLPPNNGSSPSQPAVSQSSTPPKA